MIIMRIAQAVALVFVWCLPVLLAAAEPAPAGAAADRDPRSTYAAAQELFKMEQYQQALPLFREVVESLDSPNARMYVARCLRELGQLGEAYEQLRLTVRDAASRAAAEERFVQTRDAATAELSALRKQVGFVVVSIEAPPAGVTIRVGGRAVPGAERGAEVPVTPGGVDVEAAAPGHEIARERLEVAAGERRPVSLTLTPVGEPAAVPTTPRPESSTPAADTESGGGGALTTSGVVVAGVGVAGLAVFAIAGLMADAQYDEVAGECGGVSCPDPSYDERIDEGETMDLVANVGLVVGIAGVAVGTALIIAGVLDDDEGSAGDGSSGVRFVVTPAGAWCGYGATF